MDPGTGQSGTPTVEYCGVRLTGDRIMEIEHGSVVHMAATKGIDGILVRQGFQAQRPLVQFILGAALFGLGCLAIYRLIGAFVRGGWIFAKAEAFLAAFVFLGGWLLWGGVQKGYYLEVMKGRSREKFAFRGEVDSGALERFISDVNSRFGYSIHHGPFA
jgi:hypothetical protein